MTIGLLDCLLRVGDGAASSLDGLGIPRALGNGISVMQAVGCVVEVC